MKFIKIDMNKRVTKPVWYLSAIMLPVSKLLCGNKKNTKWVIDPRIKEEKGPKLNISSHASIRDFATATILTKKRFGTFICSIEEFIGREGLMRGVGCYPKRKYTKDTVVVRQALYSLKELKRDVTIYTEARYSIIGQNERTDTGMAKLAKKAGVPICMMINHGHYLNEPQWDKAHHRGNTFEIEYRLIASSKEVLELSVEELEARIQENFKFDDYRWQYENKIKTNEYRAHNIHKALYKCPCCKKDYTMMSELTRIWCRDCGATYELSEYGEVKGVNQESPFRFPTDWYNWEREEVRKEVREGTYKFECDCRIEHLENFKVGLVPLGDVHFTQDLEGIHIQGTFEDGNVFDFNNPPINTPSIHIEYDFKKKGTVKQGQAIDINTLDETWFIYPYTEDEVLTKIHFATEELYYVAEEKIKAN